MRQEILRFDNIIMKNKDLLSLHSFNLRIFKGEIAGILTLNTVGKQDFIDVLCGNKKANFGRMYYDDVLYEAEDYIKVTKNKIFKIENISELAHDLTVADNIFTMRSNFNKYFIKNSVLYKHTDILFRELNIDINPRISVNSLSSLNRCIVELVKAYASGAKLIVLQDLDKDLNNSDLNKFYEIVLKLQSKKIAFLYINSYVDILFSYTERIIIMREGRNIFNIEKKDFDSKKAISLLMGKEYNGSFNLRQIDKSHESILEFHNIFTDNLNDVSFQLKKGEILNILDTDTRGNEDFVKLLSGSLTPKFGNIIFRGNNFYCPSLSKAIYSGIGFICENPIQNMLFKDMSVLENLSFLIGEKIDNMWLKPGIKRNIINEYYDKFKDNIYKKNIGELDMTSLIKLVYYKWHIYSPKLLVISKPFTGIDMVLRNLVVDLIYELSKKGIAILILTSNYFEKYVAGDKVILLKNNQ